MDEAEPFTPDFEGHYQKLLTTLREQASFVPPNIWLTIITGSWDKDHDEMERQRAYCENISTLPFALLYFDLPKVEPLLARVLVLARLLADNAPVAYLREEYTAAVADVTATRFSNERKAPVLLLTERMQVVPIAELFPSAPDFDLDKWSDAMAQQIWGSA